jgi:hypothetical protein
MSLHDGLYDLLITEALASQFDPAIAEGLSLGQGSADVLAEATTRQLATILDELPGEETGKAARQLEFVNALLVALRERVAAQTPAVDRAKVVDLVASPLRMLKAIRHDRQFPMSPEIGLAAPWLFTAGKGSPSLLQEIRRELASADHVDILVSFITCSEVAGRVATDHCALGAVRSCHTHSHPDHDIHRRHRSTCA